MIVLGISGSLRRGASNTALLEAARLVTPPEVIVRLYSGVGELPHFNPDLETVENRMLPPPVAALRRLIGEADALLLSTPEYAHGLPGSFKNALDWLVGSTELPGKPVAIITPTDRSVHAQAQLREILTTMSVRIIDEASRVVTVPSRDTTAEAIAADADAAAALRAVLQALRAAVA